MKQLLFQNDKLSYILLPSVSLINGPILCILGENEYFFL